MWRAFMDSRGFVLEPNVDGLIVTDPYQPDNPIVYCNEGFLHLTGYAASEVIGRNCRFLQGPGTDPRAVAILRRAQEAGQACLVTLLNHRRDGSPFWNRLMIEPINDRSGKLVHFVGVQMDVTEQMRLEGRTIETPPRAESDGLAPVWTDQLVQDVEHLQREYTQSLRAQLLATARRSEMQEFITLLAHELKRPVLTIAGLLKMLQQDVAADLDEDCRESLRLAVGECDRIKLMVSELGRLARLEETPLLPERVDVPQLIDACAEHLRKDLAAQGVELTVDCPPLRCFFSRFHVEQALTNLIENALVYGTGHAQPRVSITAQRRDDRLHISVRDNGEGIDPQHHEYVFGLFQRLRPHADSSGTGVGLAAVRRLMQRMGGEVRLESRPGDGACFTLDFPVDQDESLQRMAPSQPPHS